MGSNPFGSTAAAVELRRISGKLGLYVFKNVDGKQITTSKVTPGKIKQTIPTKSAGITLIEPVH